MKQARWVLAVFAILGVLMLGGAGWLASNTLDFRARASLTRGTVFDLSREESHDKGKTSYTYYPLVRFSVDGRDIQFRGSTGSNPPSFDVGEDVEVLYDPSHPENARLNTFFSLWMGPLILSVLGTIFFLVGAGGLVIIRGNNRKAAWLRSSGQRIIADLIGVERNTNISVNGSHPFCISAQWRNPRTGEIHVFQSASIWYNPESYLKGKTVEVLIDPANPKTYLLDTSFLPKVAG